MSLGSDIQLYGPPPVSTAWQEAAPIEEAHPQVRYRTSIVLGAWAFALVDPGKIRGALRLGELVGGVRVKRVEIFAPGGVPEDWVARGFKKSDWGVRVTWEKPSGPVAVNPIDRAAAGMGYHGQEPATAGVETAAAAIVAVIVAATIAWVVIAKWTEKETIRIAGAAAGAARAFGDALQQTVFNPGVIIAALAAIALFLRRR